MEKHGIVIIADYSEQTPLTLEELCDVCHISVDMIHQLIDYQIIHERAARLEEWQFDLAELRRIKKALRLQHDLEVNLAGVAVILDLLDQLDELRAHHALLEKHLLK